MSRREQRLASNAAFLVQRPRSSVALIRPGLGTLFVALAMTTVWYVLSVRRFAAIDAVPFIWTWLVLWLVCSLAWELWSRLRPAARPAMPRRRP